MPDNTPSRVVEYFEDNGFNSRRSTRSTIFSEFVLQDILDRNSALRSLASEGSISYSTNYHFTTGGTVANLVLGPVESDGEPAASDDEDHPIIKREPNEIWFALRVTALMTQLGRNVTNRRGDLQSMSQEAYRENEKTVTAGVVFTTVADEVQFDHHSEPTSAGLGTEEVQTVRNKLSEAISSHEKPSSDLDGLSLIVFDYDGRSSPSVYQNPPAPAPDSRLNYENFLANVSDQIDLRFLGLPDPQSATAEDLIRRNEGITIEFKQQIDDQRKLAAEAVALINTQGGAIVIGVSDDGEVTGVDDADSVQNQSVNILRDYIEDTPNIRWEVDSVEGEEVVIIRLPAAGDRLYSLDGKFYTRFGESSIAMDFRELKDFVVNWIVRQHRLDELVDN